MLGFTPPNGNNSGLMRDFMKKYATFGSFGMSALLHLAVFLAVGSWVLIQAVPPKFIPGAAADSSPELSPDESPPELPDDVTDPAPDNADADPAMDAPQPAAIPADTIIASVPGVTFNLPPAAGVYVPGAASSDTPVGGRKAGASLAKKIAIGNLFGAKVEASQLGVILDISGSAHKFLPLVIDQLDKNFADAIILLVYGGGMDATAGGAVVLPYAEAKFDPALDGAGKRSTLQQIALAEKNNPDVAKLFKRLRTRSNVYCVYYKNVGATQHAFDFLLQKNADALYWFTDFNDPVDKATGERVLQAVKAAHAKVIAHNFAAREDSVNLAYGKQLAAQTGGAVILAVPVKK